MNQNIKSKRHAMLGKLFVLSVERGIRPEFLRDYISPELIGKRLSAASEDELATMIKHFSAASAVKKKKYDSSIFGLRLEVCDLAKSRWGESWELPLNNFCLRFGVRHWKWLDVSHGKAVKDALLRLRASAETEVPF